jgi:menaquinone-dependent protoporphyrinogen oxidase
VAGGAVLVATTPRIDLPEASLTGANEKAKRLLIAYSSKAGSTAEVAVFIGKRLSDRGHAVDVRRAKHVSSLDGYHAVVVGSAIRAGQWLSEARGFVKQHKEALATRGTAFFSLCMTLHEDTPKNRQVATDYLRPMRQILEPGMIEVFAGRMDYSQLALLPRLIVKAIKTPEGDFRNWDAIAAWADRLHHEMLAGA